MTVGPPLPDLLSGTPFAPMAPEGQRDLGERFRVRRVEKGEIIFVKGETAGIFFLVAAGQLKAFSPLPDGRDITVFVLEARDFCGFLPLLDGGSYPLSVEALTPALLYTLEREEFLRFFNSNRLVCAPLMTILAQRLRDSLEQIGLMGRQRAVERVAHGLLGLAGDGAREREIVEVEIPFTQEEFARTLHLAPENLSRALTSLRREGLIERVGRRSYRVLSPMSLQHLAGDDLRS